MRSRSAVTACKGLEAARAGGHAALIVDRMLPGLDGLSLVRRLREEANNIPALFLTTMSGLDDRVEGLQAGGDDYLVKPFAFPELLARVHAITRRGNAPSGEPVRLRAADLEMDLIRRSVHRAGKAIELQAQEFRLLEYLMRNMGRVVTRAMLLENVWDLHFDPRTNIVETHISRLRAPKGGPAGSHADETDPYRARLGIYPACGIGFSAPRVSACPRFSPVFSLLILCGLGQSCSCDHQSGLARSDCGLFRHRHRRHPRWLCP